MYELMIAHLNEIQVVMAWYIVGAAYWMVFVDAEKIIKTFSSTFQVKHFAEFILLIPVLLSILIYWIVAYTLVGFYQLVIRFGNIVLWKYPEIK